MQRSNINPAINLVLTPIREFRINHTFRIFWLFVISLGLVACTTLPDPGT